MNSKTDYREKPVKEWRSEEWEEFFVALQKEMPKEKIELIHGPSGELIARWPETAFLVYVSNVCKEIRYHEDDRSHFLAFTVVSWMFKNMPVQEGIKRRGYDKICEYLKQSAQDHKWGDVFEKPEKFSNEEELGASGKVFCQTKTQNCWLAENAGGKLDMRKTVENLRKADEILQTAYQKHWQAIWRGDH
ncbi:MAG: hypothetical protein OXU40_07280 [Nitrospira sp.]|nr:hypothetical protein [Nitrospira sp.]